MILIGATLSNYRRPPHRKREGDLDPKRLQALLDAVESNPWQRISEMHVHNQPWVPYTNPGALAALQNAENHITRERAGEVELQGSGEDPIEARISTHTSIYAMMYVPDRFVVDRERPRAVAQQLLSLLPDGATAVVATEDLADFRLAQLPRPFEYWPWLAGLTPDAYADYFSREALLEAPAVDVHEDESERIWLQFYDNLLEPDAPESKATMQELHAYLRAHAQNQWLPF